MGKKYFGNENSKKKIENLKNNSTILQRISPNAILTVTKKIIPQLKDKIDGFMSKSPNINKEKLITSVASLLTATTILLSFAGCSSDISKTSRKLY